MDSRTCACLTNLTATNIYNAMRHNALAIREPNLIYGSDPNSNPGYKFSLNYKEKTYVSGSRIV